MRHPHYQVLRCRVRARSHFGHVQTVSSICFIRGRSACEMRRVSGQSLRRFYRLRLSCVNVRINLGSLVSSNLRVVGKLVKMD